VSDGTPDAPPETAAVSSPLAALRRNDTLAGVHRPPPPATHPLTLPRITTPTPTASAPSAAADGSNLAGKVNVTAWVSGRQAADLSLGGSVTNQVLRALNGLLDDPDALAALGRPYDRFTTAQLSDQGPYMQISIRITRADRDVIDAAAAKHVGGRGARSRLIRAALAHEMTFGGY
jgi:hypothetical protein